jgi:hypothetical protein
MFQTLRKGQIGDLFPGVKNNQIFNEQINNSLSLKWF